MPEGLKPLFEVRLQDLLKVVAELVPVMFQRRHT